MTFTVHFVDVQLQLLCTDSGVNIYSSEWGANQVGILELDSVKLLENCWSNTQPENGQHSIIPMTCDLHIVEKQCDIYGNFVYIYICNHDINMAGPIDFLTNGDRQYNYDGALANAK